MIHGSKNNRIPAYFGVAERHEIEIDVFVKFD